MRIFFSTWVLTLAMTFGSLGVVLPVYGQSLETPWLQAGYDSYSRKGDLWYQPKPDQNTPWNCYRLTDMGVSIFSGVENFRGIPDADAGDNNGIHLGIELATSLPYLKKYAIGFQAGGSFGVFDFAGRGRTRHNHSLQNQGFFTTGFFIRPQSKLPLGLGIVYDWMINHNYSIYAESPTIEQIRGQVSYFFTRCDELGIWGTYDTTSSHKFYHYRTFDYRITYRAIAQANVFWRHLFDAGVETTLWLGTPLRHRLDREHSDRPGKYIVGLEISVPFLNSWAIVGRATYMQPGTKRGALGSREYASNIAVNVIYYFGGDPNAAPDSASAAWMPYLPMSNNSNFLVDSATKVIKHKSGF